jgi:glycosyltransferase involved in cell wall biosynthesis
MNGNRRTIAFISGPLNDGGAEQQLFHLLGGLDRGRWSPLVLHVSDRHEGVWRKPIEDLGVRILHFDRRGGRPRRIVRMAQALRAERVDIVHSSLLYLNPYAAIAGKLAGVPVRIGGICEDARPGGEIGLARRLGYYGCDIFISNFAAAGGNLPARVMDEGRHRVVYSGIPPSDLVDEQRRNQLRAAIGCAPDQQLIGAVGRMDENKNFASLIRAFSGIAERWPRASLVLVGGGPLRTDLEALARGLDVGDRVLFPGRLPGAAQSDIFPMFDVACLTSRSEGFPIVLLEAGMAGVPVVSTVCGGTPELIEEGQTGYLTPREDDHAVADRIERLLSDPARSRQMGRAARQRVLDRFTVSRMVLQTVTVYDEALSRAAAA